MTRSELQSSKPFNMGRVVCITGVMKGEQRTLSIAQMNFRV